MKKLFCVLPLMALTACGTSAVVSDINDSAVHVQVDGDINHPAVRLEAQRGCSQYGKQPTYISHRCVDELCVTKDVLFTCS